jgi:hypothetical protein
MGRLTYALACSQDDAELRRLLADTPMDGRIRLAFEREPSYFHAVRVQGGFAQVVVARDAETGALVGTGSRVVRPGFVNGEVRPVGYLGDLRLRPPYRRRWAVARGYRLFRDLHADGRADLYYTVIAAENRVALATIAAGRAGLPPYRDLGLVHAPAINLGRRLPPVPVDAAIVRGEPGLLPEIVGCLTRNGQRKQFAPCYAVEDFRAADGRLRDFRVDDFYVAVRGSRVVGTLARWDQRAFKQTRVAGYAGPLRLLRPLVNLGAPVLGLPRFPPPGGRLDAFYVTFVAVDDDDPRVFAALLQRCCNDAVGQGYAYGLVGLHARDPLAAALADYRRTPFQARLFCVHFEDGAESFRRLDGRVPHVEVALL